jgi:hypothetical protein
MSVPGRTVGMILVSAIVVLSADTGRGAEPGGPPPAAEPLSGTWRLSDERTGNTQHLILVQSGDTITGRTLCGFLPDRTSLSGTVKRDMVVLMISGDRVSLNCSGTIRGPSLERVTCADSGTWTLTRLDQQPTDKECARDSAEVFCSYSYIARSWQYTIESLIKDPKAVIRSATLSGFGIEKALPYIYNVYFNRPDEWWAYPKVIVSTAAPPAFPLDYSITITFQDGTSQLVSRNVTTWEFSQ